MAEGTNDICAEFALHFSSTAEFVVRAPGRVNLIGEHIDYSGYTVLPMALEGKEISIAVNTYRSSINELNRSIRCDIRNTDSSFPSKVYDVLPRYPSSQILEDSWTNYFLCGWWAICDLCVDSESIEQINVLVDGKVPAASGLSSSSALVVASALACLTAFHQSIDRNELANRCCQSERYIGTMGGGMDQAISCLAKKDCAKLVTFEPRLTTEDIELPLGSTFVVTNSCVSAEKAKGAKLSFNMRVLESRLVALVVSSTLGFEICFSPEGRYRLVDITGLPQMKDNAYEWKQNYFDALRAIESLHEDSYSYQELTSIVAEEYLLSIFSQDRFKELLEDEGEKVFRLRQRGLHILEEAARVYSFAEVCSQKEGSRIAELGRIMLDSHSSCRNQYECSCAELDELVDACIESGAVGARLTGAGWGGCVVALLPDGEKHAITSSFFEQLSERYYNPRGISCDNVCFVTYPGDGVCVIINDQQQDVD